MFKLAFTFMAVAFLTSTIVLAVDDPRDPDNCSYNCFGSGMSAATCSHSGSDRCLCTDQGYITAYNTCVEHNCPTLPQDIRQEMDIGCTGSAVGNDSPNTQNGNNSPNPSSTSGATFRTASIGSGVSLVLFGAAVSLF